MIFFIISLITFVLYLIPKNKKAIHMLQQNWYDLGKRYFLWILKNKKKIFVNIEVLFIFFILFIMLNIYISVSIFFIFYLILFIIQNYNQKKHKTIIALQVTVRAKRLITTTVILYLIPIIIMLFIFNEEHIYIYYLILGLMAYLAYYVVELANIINKPVEKYFAWTFKVKAKKKLKSMNDLKVVGITGSYGKTSSKNILSDILNIKYKTLPTPKNFNTPVGLIITVNNHMDKFDEVFIAEMGAYKKGEIKELCDLVNPKYGILTKIGVAHLESFGSEKNIQEGKFELIESLPKDGVGVLNRDDENQVSYKLKNTCKILWIGINSEDVDVRATNIVCSSKGTTFDVTFKGDENTYKFETRLLGTANVYNILAGIALGYELSISIKDLIKAVSNVKAVEHRLELKKMGDINLIDDAYNANPVGTKMALDVLNLMEGKKIMISSGMIELGDKQYELNKEYGEYMADICDEIILVGKTHTKPIQDGLKEKGYDESKIHLLDDVRDAFPLLNKLKDNNTYVLLSSDLPDIFSE